MTEGNSLAQYGHQVAQKYRSTTRPVSSRRLTIWPSTVGSEAAGGLWPPRGTTWKFTSRVSTDSAPAVVADRASATTAATSRLRIRWLTMSSIFPANVASVRQDIPPDACRAHHDDRQEQELESLP